ncbi:uncharacterized protein LOC144152616 [Haemaphysalis longicornis]
MAVNLKKSAYMLVCMIVLGAVVAKCEDADIFKAITNFPNVTAIYSKSATYANANLECFTAELTHLDKKEGTANYTWYLPKQSGEPSTIVHHLMEADSPYEVNVITSPGPDTAWTAIWPYSDNKCIIAKAKDTQDVCLLFVNNDSVDNVPEECTEQYKNICGEGVLLYDKDKCTKRRQSSSK